MTAPDSTSTTITTYSLDGSSWTSKRPPMCKIYYTREVNRPVSSDMDTVQALIESKVHKYFDAMEGADGNDFMKAEWAHGAMSRLLVEFKMLRDAVMAGKGK